ncbi:Putative polyhydroxyalkanoic acid system protein (PHA_gran_rgn) [Anatilimnocola aggregata]|uniref:Polyhydroxyalkanoic acid system protein (PHA_gran_rgn) n=1 Tax=Anatilimnocola aggregata TaxID=2528021 RepID=A0A517YIF0_9BACT|nr:polyhydroxyalkanoic acid system family protein [Anatilimnocola aggregata]QDU29999.1 Putative polyhydroxyalkanoic acid system protein (PHA_gran_rgn) [Anatilimnocola aggregata]
MPSLKIKVPHALQVAEAVKRLQTFLDEVRRDHADRVSNVQGVWQDDTLAFGFTAMGMKIDGTLVVYQEEVLVSGNLPFAASLFRGQIEQTIRGELEKLLV